MWTLRRLSRFRVSNFPTKSIFSSSAVKCDETINKTDEPIVENKKENKEPRKKGKELGKKSKEESYEIAITKKVAETMAVNEEDVQKTSDELLSYIKGFKTRKEKFNDRKDEFKEHYRTLVSASDSMVLDILKPSLKEKGDYGLKLKLWDQLEAEALTAMSKKSPSNYFEELIQWTEEGKLWKFPINNEQGLEEEAKIHFTEHIFLEQHLEPWCPKVGPLRKFMELVLIGLSKNPFITLEEKKSHIYWFRDYFEEKKKLLKDLGADGSTKEILPSQSANKI